MKTGISKWTVGGAALLVGLIAAAPVAAETSLSKAKWTFEKHSEAWMEDLEQNEAENRRKAPTYTVAEESVIRFQGYAEDWETEVKPTGSTRAPFVGILRYRENVYTCLRDDQDRCTVTSSIPVSEIFSFRNGRWEY